MHHNTRTKISHWNSSMKEWICTIIEVRINLKFPAYILNFCLFMWLFLLFIKHSTAFCQSYSIYIKRLFTNLSASVLSVYFSDGFWKLDLLWQWLGSSHCDNLNDILNLLSKYLRQLRPYRKLKHMVGIWQI